MNIRRKLPLLIAALACSQGAFAQTPFAFDNGDLILGFQATSGTGTTQNVFFNLGSAVTLRDNGNAGAAGNIGATLSSVYGSNWYTREDLRFGVIGNLNPNLPGGLGAPAPVDGDPSATLYVSHAAPSPGQGSIWAGYSATALNNVGGRVQGIESILPGLTAGPDRAAILDQNLHPTAWQNGWWKNNPLPPDAAFGILEGTIEQHFGQGGSAVYLDIQRILPTSTGANPSGPVGTGVYISTLAIGADGSLTLSKAGSPGGGDTAFEEWIAQYESQIPNEADRQPGANPTGDGIVNLLKFAFAGSPVVAGDRGTHAISTQDANGDSQGDLTLTVEVRAGANFSASGGAQTAAVDGIVYRIEGSETLTDFTSPVSPMTPHLGQGSPKAGYEFRTFRLEASSGLPGRGFLRAVVEEAPVD